MDLFLSHISDYIYIYPPSASAEFTCILCLPGIIYFIQITLTPLRHTKANVFTLKQTKNIHSCISTYIFMCIFCRIVLASKLNKMCPTHINTIAWRCPLHRTHPVSMRWERREKCPSYPRIQFFCVSCHELITISESEFTVKGVLCLFITLMFVIILFGLYWCTTQWNRVTHPVYQGKLLLLCFIQ